MKNYILQHWAPLCLLGMALALAVWYFVTMSIKDYRNRRLSLLRAWRENQLQAFLSHKHWEPVKQLENIEDLSRDYRYSEKELGVSLNGLLGHAVMCQRLKVSTLKENLAKCIVRIETERHNQQCLIESFIARMRADLTDHDGLVKLIAVEEAKYVALNERWIRSCGHDPKSTPRIDIYQPQTA